MNFWEFQPYENVELPTGTVPDRGRIFITGGQGTGKTKLSRTLTEKLPKVAFFIMEGEELPEYKIASIDTLPKSARVAYISKIKEGKCQTVDSMGQLIYNLLDAGYDFVFEEEFFFACPPEKKADLLHLIFEMAKNFRAMKLIYISQSPECESIKNFNTVFDVVIPLSPGHTPANYKTYYRREGLRKTQGVKRELIYQGTLSGKNDETPALEGSIFIGGDSEVRNRELIRRIIDGAGRGVQVIHHEDINTSSPDAVAKEVKKHIRKQHVFLIEANYSELSLPKNQQKRDMIHVLYSTIKEENGKVIFSAIGDEAVFSRLPLKFDTALCFNDSTNLLDAKNEECAVYGRAIPVNISSIIEKILTHENTFSFESRENTRRGYAALLTVWGKFMGRSSITTVEELDFLRYLIFPRQSLALALAIPIDLLHSREGAEVFRYLEALWGYAKLSYMWEHLASPNRRPKEGDEKSYIEFQRAFYLRYNGVLDSEGNESLLKKAASAFDDVLQREIDFYPVFEVVEKEMRGLPVSSPRKDDDGFQL